MTATTLGTLLLTTQVAFGGLFGGLHLGKGSHCGPCRTSHPAVHREVSVLLECPNWKDRRASARALRQVDWKCHPEIVPALVHAMLHDRHDKVRSNSAETLAKLAPCTPDAHAALVLVAQKDPHHWTRKWANKALGNLNRRCIADCSHCGPVPTSLVTAGPGVFESETIIEVHPGPMPAPGPGPGFGPGFEPVPPPGYAPQGEFLPPGAAGSGLPPVPDPTQMPGRSSLRPTYPEETIEATPIPGLEPPSAERVPDLPRSNPGPAEPPVEALPEPSDDSPFIVPPEATNRPAPGRTLPAPTPNRSRFTSLVRPFGPR